jgi:hypothetical protein
MLFGLQIGLLIAGLVALYSGRFRLSATRVAQGPAARFAGLLLTLPIPLGFTVIAYTGVPEAPHLRGFDDREWWDLFVIEGSITLACAALGLTIALSASSRPPSPQEELSSDPTRLWKDLRREVQEPGALKDPSLLDPIPSTQPFGTATGPLDYFHPRGGERTDQPATVPPASFEARPFPQKRRTGEPLSAAAILMVLIVLGAIGIVIFLSAIPALQVPRTRRGPAPGRPLPARNDGQPGF